MKKLTNLELAIHQLKGMLRAVQTIREKENTLEVAVDFTPLRQFEGFLVNKLKDLLFQQHFSETIQKAEELITPMPPRKQQPPPQEPSGREEY